MMYCLMVACQTVDIYTKIDRIIQVIVLSMCGTANHKCPLYCEIELVGKYLEERFTTEYEKRRCSCSSYLVRSTTRPFVCFTVKEVHTPVYLNH